MCVTKLGGVWRTGLLEQFPGKESTGSVCRLVLNRINAAGVHVRVKQSVSH